MLLYLFAFVAGLITVASPCVLPILPIILSTSLTTGRLRPAGVAVGFIGGFTLFTLTLAHIISTTGIAPSTFRFVSIGILFCFGLVLVFPALWKLPEQWLHKLINKISPKPTNTRTGFFGGIIIGLSIGLLWSPCVGPILGSVVTLALNGIVTGNTVLVTFAYAAGTTLPLLLIVLGGRTFIAHQRWLATHSARLQQYFGTLTIVVALGLLWHVDQHLQTWIIGTFPEYVDHITRFENLPSVQEQIQQWIK